MPRLARAPVLAVLLVLGLAGCAAPGLEQLYVPLSGGAGWGYTAQMTSNDQAVVSYTSPLDTAFTYQGSAGQQEINQELARAFDFALLRSAELAQSKGYPAFRVTNRTNDASVRRFYQPYDYDYGYPHFHRFGFPYYPYGFPSDNSYETLYTRVTLDVTFEKAVTKGAYNAAEVEKTIRGRYAPPPPAQG